MCGRFRLISDYAKIKLALKLDDNGRAPNFPPRWNIPPTADILVAGYNPKTRKRTPVLMRWGLIPGWAKDPKVGFTTFNARADGIDAKPAFRGAWAAGRRCLVIADGFYEWRKADKQPFAVGMADDGLMVMAGLWDSWKSETGETIHSVTIVTTDANEALAPIHERMPVILKPQDWPRWIGEDVASESELKALLKPYPSEGLKLWEVDKRVGNVKNDGPDLAEPLETSAASI